LFSFLLSDRYQDYVSGASTGTTRKSASAGVITDLPILVPDSAVGERYERLIRDTRQMLNNLLDRNCVLRRTRDFLLPKLISGEVPVRSAAELVEQTA
jgi:type I restriction enzyme, S subunit